QDSPTYKQLMAPFLEVQKQGAFVFYNHPGYSWWDRKDTNIFTSFHKDLLDKGILAGVEVVNSNRYNIIAHRIAMKYNLTMVANSDAHYDMYADYAETHRPMTLVFAREKTEESIREALVARRTALYFDDYLVARQPEAEAFFKASLAVTTEKAERKGELILKVHFRNTSDLPFHIRARAPYDVEGWPLGQATLKARQTTTLILKAVWSYPQQVPLEVEVSNILVSPDAPLKTTIHLTPSASSGEEAGVKAEK
ncbi:MAG TPA: Sb-PDE family phosphodiesterase, partial [Chitinophagaceae bacterium]|nr:Sb-PDE family phosphodiesterase [Chitinophagaceae bacterium]